MPTGGYRPKIKSPQVSDKPTPRTPHPKVSNSKTLGISVEVLETQINSKSVPHTWESASDPSQLETMDIEDADNVDGLSKLAEFVFDQFTPESDDETRIDESPDVPLSLQPAPRDRTRRRRARKACVACNKR